MAFVFRLFCLFVLILPVFEDVMAMDVEKKEKEKEKGEEKKRRPADASQYLEINKRKREIPVSIEEKLKSNEKIINGIEEISKILGKENFNEKSKGEVLGIIQNIPKVISNINESQSTEASWQKNEARLTTGKIKEFIGSIRKLQEKAREFQHSLEQISIKEKLENNGKIISGIREILEIVERKENIDEKSKGEVLYQVPHLNKLIRVIYCRYVRGVSPAWQEKAKLSVPTYTKWQRKP